MNWIILGLAVLLFAGERRVQGQGTIAPVVLRTGAGQAIVSSLVTLPPVGPNAYFSFEFGFSTDEVFGPGRIFDSFTVSVGRPGSLEVLILATLDASGAVFVPVSPGGIQVDPATVTRTVTAFPPISPSYAAKSAYVLSGLIGAELAGSPLTVYFDLFDNLDAESSLGYFGQVLLVPEPPAWALSSVGFLLLLWLRRVLKR
ncbi:MAG: hypothetical protein ABI651_13170 [Verrucomicrobiota bacterium]